MDNFTEKNTLKVALILSGQPRFYNSYSYDSIKREILNKYNPDVFFHTWYSENKDMKYEFASWSSIQELKFPETTKEDIIKLYNPKSYIIDDPNGFKYPSKLVSYLDPSKHPEFKHNKMDDILYMYRNVPQMLYSLSKSAELCNDYAKKNNIKYDIIIRARFDTHLVNLPSLEYLRSVGNQTLYVPDNCPNIELYNDNFAIWIEKIGKQIVEPTGEQKEKTEQLTDKIFDIYLNIEEYVKEKGIIPENIFKAHIDKFSISVKKLNMEQFYQNFSRGWD